MSVGGTRYLVPLGRAAFAVHNFWAVTDPMMAQWQLGAFMWNLSRIGMALLIAHFGAGPVSLDERGPGPRDDPPGGRTRR